MLYSYFLCPKGVVMLDRQTGVWLSHSTPRFPVYRNRNFWPNNGNTNAQTFMCVTFSYDQFKEIGRLIMLNPPVFMEDVTKGVKMWYLNFQGCSSNTSMLIHMTIASHQPFMKSCDVSLREYASPEKDPGLERHRWRPSVDALSPALQNMDVLRMVSVRSKNQISGIKYYNVCCFNDKLVCE